MVKSEYWNGVKILLLIMVELYDLFWDFFLLDRVNLWNSSFIVSFSDF